MLSNAQRICHSRPDASCVIRKEAKKKVDNKSIHPINLVLSDFPFDGATQYLDIYALFSVQAGQGCWKTQIRNVFVARNKQSIIKRMWNARRGWLRAYELIYYDKLIRCWRNLNVFQRDTDRVLHMQQWWTTVVECCVQILWSSWNAWAADIKNLDLISRFIRELPYLVYEQLQTCPITIVFTEHVNIMKCVCWRSARSHGNQHRLIDYGEIYCNAKLLQQGCSWTIKYMKWELSNGSC